MLDFAISSFVTLLLVVDPVGLVPAFIAVTEDLSVADRRVVALRASLIATGILIFTAVGGNWLLLQLRIGVPAFQIAGGMLLFVVGFRMIFGTRPRQETRDASTALKEHLSNIAAFPLAIPLMAGPGALTATLLSAGRAQNLIETGILIAAIFCVCVLSVLAFNFALTISRLLGPTGNIVLSRILGIILAAFSAQFVIDGIKLEFFAPT